MRDVLIACLCHALRNLVDGFGGRLGVTGDVFLVQREKVQRRAIQFVKRGVRAAADSALLGNVIGRMNDIGQLVAI